MVNVINLTLHLSDHTKQLLIKFNCLKSKIKPYIVQQKPCCIKNLKKFEIFFFADGIMPGGGRRGLRLRSGNRTTDYGFIDAPPQQQQQQLQQQQQHQQQPIINQPKLRVKEHNTQFGKIGKFFLCNFGWLVILETKCLHL